MRARVLTVGVSFFLATFSSSPLFAAGPPAPAAGTAGWVGTVQTKESQSALKPAGALKMLKDGNERFATERRLRRSYTSQVKASAKGQAPFAAILGCMDSRASHEIVFDQGIGDIFSIRVAGNVVDEDDLGSLEYAAKLAGVKLVVVMGHTSCGAVKGAIEDEKLGNLTALLAKIKPAVAASGHGEAKEKAYVTKVVEANVRQSMKEIREKSPVLKELFDSGAVGLVGAVYDIETGKVTFWAD